MGKRKTNNEWYDLFNNKHNFKYKYIDIITEKNRRFVVFDCGKHDIQKQRIEQHLKGFGCQKCYNNEKKINSNHFINAMNEIHNNKYSYIDGYKNMKTKIKIKCEKHGIFYLYPIHHKNGQGCKKCKMDKHNELKLFKFINNANIKHNFKFRYDKFIYNGYNKKSIITCPIHGDFLMSSYSHLKGRECKKCKIDEQTKTNKQFLLDANKIHNNFYIYPEKYVNSNRKMLIICPLHGSFYQLPKNHTSNKQGCPKCNRSNGELEIEMLLNDFNLKYIIEYKFEKCINKLPLPFDFYLPEHNLCIEYDGEQHFKENTFWGGKDAFKKQQIRDKIKTDYCKENNIHLLRIRYDENILEKLNFILTL